MAQSIPDSQTKELSEDIPIEDEEPIEDFEDWGDEEWSEDESTDDAGDTTESGRAPLDPELDTDPNPLNSAGSSLDQLIETQFNSDVWTDMLGDLPCLDASERCVQELQMMAIATNTTLQDIQIRIDAIEERIEDARARNSRTARMGVLEPLVTDLVQIDPVERVPDPSNPQEPGSIIIREERGFLENALDIFISPTRGINQILSLIRLPLFRGVSGGDAAAQQRQIAIADLQVKVAEIQRAKAQMENDLREAVVMAVLDFDTTRREFQIAQEVARRSQLRLEILTLDYRFAASGTMDTPRYLQEMSALDEQKAQTWRAWSRLRTQLTRIKILVLGGE